MCKFSTTFPVHHEETILDQSGTNIFITCECCNERLSTIPRKYNKYKDNRALFYLLVLYVELDSLIQQVLLYALYGFGCEIFIRRQLREGETVGLGVPTLGLERSW